MEKKIESEINWILEKIKTSGFKRISDIIYFLSAYSFINSKYDYYEFNEDTATDNELLLLEALNFNKENIISFKQVLTKEEYSEIVKENIEDIKKQIEDYINEYSSDYLNYYKNFFEEEPEKYFFIDR